MALWLCLYLATIYYSIYIYYYYYLLLYEKKKKKKKYIDYYRTEKPTHKTLEPTPLCSPLLKKKLKLFYNCGCIILKHNKPTK